MPLRFQRRTEGWHSNRAAGTRAYTTAYRERARYIDPEQQCKQSKAGAERKSKIWYENASPRISFFQERPMRSAEAKDTSKEACPI